MNEIYVYSIVSVLLFIVWIILYILNPTLRRKILLISLLTTPLGLTEPLFVPSYWLPFTLFDLARRTRFDLESLLFSFAIGGIAAILYESVVRKSRIQIAIHEMHAPRHQFHRLALLSPFLSFGVLYFATPLNPIYSASIAMVIGAVATAFCRPDLLKAMVVGSFLFASLYFTVFLVGFVWLSPGYVQKVWNLPAISGILVVGIPIEELLWAATLGAMWSSLYEHFAWSKLSERHNV